MSAYVASHREVFTVSQQGPGAAFVALVLDEEGSSADLDPPWLTLVPRVVRALWPAEAPSRGWCLGICILQLSQSGT